MTDREAIGRIIDHMAVHHIGEYPHIKLEEALKCAISALEERIDREKNEPLTIEELRQMNGQPVWCADLKEWGIVKMDTIGGWANIPFLLGHYGDYQVRINFEYDIESRGLECYRRPLKGEYHD